MMKLTDPAIRSFRVAQVFRENMDKINSLDFAPNGNFLISCSEDDQIIIYDCEKGKKFKTINSKKYGVDLIHFMRSPNKALHASTKIDDTIRLLSLSDSKYVRYFPGHTKKVISLSVSPVDATFLSGSLDQTICLWDSRTSTHVKRLNVAGIPLVVYDPEALVIAAGINSECIKLFDLRRFDKKPFKVFHLNQEKDCNWTNLKMAPDGKTMLISTNGSLIRLVNAFDGSALNTLTGYANTKGVPFEASYSPDAKYIFSGSTDGRIHVWNAENGCKVCVFNGGHPGAVQCVQFNPKYMHFASACTNISFWLPNMNADIGDIGELCISEFTEF